MTYTEKLKDPRWQKKRLEIFKRDNWKCRGCRESNSTLHVHHFYYIKGNDPWEYPNKHLVTICKDCHDFYHEQMITLQMAFAELDFSGLIGHILNTNKEGFVAYYQKEIDKENGVIRKTLEKNA